MGIPHDNTTDPINNAATSSVPTSTAALNSDVTNTTASDKSEVEELTGQIKRRDFQMMSDCFEGYDVQETRRISHEEGISIGRSEGCSEVKFE